MEPDAKSEDETANVAFLETVLRRADLWTQGLMSATASIETRLLGVTGFHFTASLALIAFSLRAVEKGQTAWVFVASAGLVVFFLGAICGVIGLLTKSDYGNAGLFIAENESEAWKRRLEKKELYLLAMVEQVGNKSHSVIGKANNRRARALSISVWLAVAGLALVGFGFFSYVILCPC
ncbi:MAG: hypothetical protein OXU61_05415 [Gammaproteobacteria bacterium]|nr:hypothetical protein [Gammaproteobacteria bacterium]